MKTMLRNSPWLMTLLICSLISATFLFAEVTTKPTTQEASSLRSNSSELVAPSQREASDSKHLIEAIAAGEVATVAEVLRAHGLADNSIRSVTAEIDKQASRIDLSEPFLKAAVALSLSGRASNVQQRLESAKPLNSARPVWIARWLETNWVERCDMELARSPLPPIAVLNVHVDDPCFIRFFQWYDRYADRLHSVVLNGDDLTNAKIKSGYDQAAKTLHALYKLIKSRKPDAFVWLSVVKQDDKTDEAWLKAMPFRPDGLQISNLRQFHSPFSETRQRYIRVLGEDLPMMVHGFYGHKVALQMKGRALSEAKKIADSQMRVAAKEEVATELGGIGALAEQDLALVEEHLKALGYRGLSLHSLLVEAIANKEKRGAVDSAYILDRRAGLLVDYFAVGNDSAISSITAAMISESAPGDMNWIVAKTYDAMLLLTQIPPKTKEGAAILDEVLALDYSGRPGSDYYVLLATKWRVHAALLSGDIATAKTYVQRVQGSNFRKDLVADFLKHYEHVLTLQESQSR